MLAAALMATCAVAACNLWSSALSANALLLSASALALPGAPRGRKWSPRAADTSVSEKGTHSRMATSTLNICIDRLATNGLTGAGKNSAKANVSLASPRSEVGCDESRSGKTAL